MPRDYSIKITYDVPEPDWWARARRLTALGMGPYAIATRMGKSPNAVKCAVDPEHRAKVLKRKEYYNRNRKTPAPKLTAEERLRIRLRKHAREQWREDGKIRKLAYYYKDWECE